MNGASFTKAYKIFFAASYIKNRPEVNAKKVYETLAKKYHPEWVAELLFLSEIDTYRYAKYFYIPAAKKMLQIPPAQELFKPKINNSLIRSILGCYTTTATMSKTGEKEREITATIEIDDENSTPINEIMIECINFLISQTRKSDISLAKMENEAISVHSSISTVMNSVDGKTNARKFVTLLIDKLFDNLNKYEKLIKSSEYDSFDDIFS